MDAQTTTNPTSQTDAQTTAQTNPIPQPQSNPQPQANQPAKGLMDRVAAIETDEISDDSTVADLQQKLNVVSDIVKSFADRLSLVEADTKTALSKASVDDSTKQKVEECHQAIFGS